MLSSLRAIALFVACGLHLVAQDTAATGSVRGSIRGESGAVAAGLEVCLSELERCAVTDENGAFRFTELRAGPYVLVFRPIGMPDLGAEVVEVRAGIELQFDVTVPGVADLDRPATVITVTAAASVAPEEVKTSGFLVEGREVFKTAGSLQDVSRYVTSLPGVAGGSADFRNDIIVRGGSPLENLFIVDNIEVPNINNFANFASAGGTASIIDPLLVEDVTFLTGGYPAPYINRASSVLQITQREGDRDRFGGRLTLGFPGVGTVLEGPIHNGKGSWLVSARRSFIDIFTDDTGIGGVPAFYSSTAKVLYDLSPKDRLWAVSITGVDDIRLGITEDIDPEEGLSTLDINYNGWRNATGLNWQRLFGSRGVGLLGITHSQASLDQNVRDIIRSGLPLDSTPVDDLIAASPFVFQEDSSEGETTLKYDHTAYTRLGKVQAGGSFKLFNLSYTTRSPFGYDGPFTLVPDVNPIDLRKSFSTTQSSAYLQTTADLTDRLNITLGGRVDNYALLAATRFSPRAGLSYRLTNKLYARGSYGQYFQQPPFLFLAAFEKNQGLEPIRADHFVGGVSYVVNSATRVTVEAYRKNYKDYPVALQFPQLSFANVGDTFDVRDILYPMTSAGRGHAHGIELFAEKKFSRKWFGQANLAVQQTRHGGLDEIRRPGAFDYPVILNLVGGYRLDRKWELATRFGYLAGRPFTPFDQALSTNQRRGVFDLTRVNSERAPDFYRLDIRVDRTFMVNEKPLLVFFGFQNITNRENFGGIEWSRRLNRQVFEDSNGLFPLFGLEWQF